MWPFEHIASREYEELLKRVINVEQRVNGCEMESETLRNKVLRKMQTKRIEEEEENLDIPSGLLTTRGVKVGPSK
jgi:hypothetical protein